ncbi:hypothetical protein N185_15590 [Sinorhizobium sp. GW3]|nr:hypothetical protein N185_15590 [Sinorhizobium sp. GW3]
MWKSYYACGEILMIGDCLHFAASDTEDDL